MPLIDVILVLIVIGVLVWVIDYIPWIDPAFKQVIRVVAVVATVLWLVSLFLPWHISSIRIGR